jgi:BASS family bile acid:Na+ symporter
MRMNDLILFAVIFGSIAVAVYLPEAGKIFQPYLLYFMMIMLFLSFLKIDFSALLDTKRVSLPKLVTLASIKLLVLPTVLYVVALFAIPDYAIPILLLSGISTGVVAPFMAGLLDADVATVLRMVIITSLVVPFSLPCLVKLLAGAEISIPLDVMIRLLAVVIFIPMAAVIALRRLAPQILEKISQSQFPVSLLLFALINLAVFSKYSSFFFDRPDRILVSLAVAYVLSVIYYLTGFMLIPTRQPRRRLAAGLSLGLMNNVLVIVFASSFFGPLSPTLAAMYMFPFFTMIVPVKLLAHRIERGFGRPEKE